MEGMDEPAARAVAQVVDHPEKGDREVRASQACAVLELAAYLANRQTTR
jgi:hypothetical protein